MSDRTNGNNDGPERIEDRIKTRQEDLREDLDALEDKVSPENLKRQAAERVDEATDAVKERAVDLTREAGDTVRHRVDDVSDRFRSGESMSTWSLLGLAAIIGVGLLVTRGSRGRDAGRGDRDRMRGGHDAGGNPGWAGRDAGRVDPDDLREPRDAARAYPRTPRG